MEEKRRVPMTREISDPKLQELISVCTKIGQYQAFEFIKNLSAIQIAKLLGELHENETYKKIPGFNTWEDVCDMFGISRAMSYRLKDVYKKAGPELLEVMIKADFSVYDQYQLLRGVEIIEDAEFRIIDPDRGEIEIRGERMRVSEAPDLVAVELQRAHDMRKLERARRLEVERKLEETQEDLERKNEKIRIGEQRKIASENGVLELTELDKAISQLVKSWELLNNTRWSEADLRLTKRHWAHVSDSVIEPLKRLFSNKTHDIEILEMKERGEYGEDPESII